METDIEKVESKLLSMLDTVQEMSNILLKSKEIGEDLSMTSFYKNIEDGILNKMHKANKEQFDMVMTSYKFRYYTEFNKDRQLLKNEVTRRIREKKLNKLIG